MEESSSDSLGKRLNQPVLKSINAVEPINKKKGRLWPTDVPLKESTQERQNSPKKKPKSLNADQEIQPRNNIVPPKKSIRTHPKEPETNEFCRPLLPIEKKRLLFNKRFKPLQNNPVFEEEKKIVEQPQQTELNLSEEPKGKLKESSSMPFMTSYYSFRVPPMSL